ncbi:MAG TPA: DNA polymerase domain-containing protein, partial [Anaerolineales bacterium]|nr:DNA polymerase domain-containing protein [Anaerolineales bacterium]
AARRAFPDLTWYDADVPFPLRAAARYGVFPLARCEIECEGDRLLAVRPLDSPWDLDPEPPPLRALHLEPDSDPAHRDPRCLHVTSFDYGRKTRALPLRLRSGQGSGQAPHGVFEIPLAMETQAEARRLLVSLRVVITRVDPDLIVIPWGDTWVLPRLLDLSEKWGLPLPLNRDPDRAVERRKELSCHAYGQIVYRGQQIHLSGRWHIDPRNAMLYGEYGLEGAFETARLTGLGLQDAARKSPGAGISAMQLVTALRSGILIPHEKQQAETPKSALDLIHADRGGMVYPPITGLHRHVAEIDFVSMYPALMVHHNISPEVSAAERADRPFGSASSAQGKTSGLVPRTLAPLLAKRVALKGRLLGMPAWHPDRLKFKARATAQKWLLVTCFGYLGYKNARFGRIEAHEAVTAGGREALLDAKEAAEDAGYRALHLYVDGLWVQRDGLEKPAEMDGLLDEIAHRTGLPIALEGIYDWIAFLPSRVDARLAVPNRYFGRFQSGEIKMRGIAARRRDTPPYVKESQLELIRGLPADPDRLGECLPELVDRLGERIAGLRAGRAPLEELVVAQRLSKVLAAYRVPSPAARAAAQLEAAGKYSQPGMRVRFVYTRGEPGVWAWDLPGELPRARVDPGRYIELLLRAAAEALWPFGIPEATVRNWLCGGADHLAAPGVVPQLDAVKGWLWGA